MPIARHGDPMTHDDLYPCDNCGRESLYPVCEDCGARFAAEQAAIDKPEAVKVTRDAAGRVTITFDGEPIAGWALEPTCDPASLPQLARLCEPEGR